MSCRLFWDFRCLNDDCSAGSMELSVRVRREIRYKTPSSIRKLENFYNLLGVSVQFEGTTALVAIQASRQVLRRPSKNHQTEFFLVFMRITLIQKKTYGEESERVITKRKHIQRIK